MGNNMIDLKINRIPNSNKTFSHGSITYEEFKKLAEETSGRPIKSIKIDSGIVMIIYVDDSGITDEMAQDWLRILENKCSGLKLTGNWDD